MKKRKPGRPKGRKNSKKKVTSASSLIVKDFSSKGSKNNFVKTINAVQEILQIKHHAYMLSKLLSL